ncbi:MAG: hypothetical protein BMS9Abin26_1267 [Gammaproteobacteria bacterium]|nr:MAG: hypothetical protein BMS9Abin26_1267 [Gammaproteobacteria bacterium]
MNTVNTRLRLFKLLLCAVLLLPFSLSASSPVAMISDLQGKVTLHGNDKAAEILSELNVGDIVNVDAGGKLVVVFYDSGNEFSVSGPSAIRIGAAAPEPVNGNKPTRKDSSYDKGLKSIKSKTFGLAQAALVLRSAGKGSANPELRGLVDTRTLDSYPVFRWKPFKEQSVYHLELTDATGLTIIETDVTGNEYRTPENITLKPNEDYFWYLSVKIKGRKYTGRGDFSMVDNQARKDVEAHRPQGKAGVSDRVIFATWLESNRYNDEARKYWVTLAKERPDVESLRKRAQQ